MTIIFKKFSHSLGTNRGTAFAVLILYGVALIFILFNTVHDRSDEEFRKRLVPRYNKAIMVWVDHGYLALGGLAFEKPLEEDPRQYVWRSMTMGYMQLAHLFQRIHVAVTGEFGYFLMALHNQFFPMLSSAFLGFLAMRLSLQMKIPPLHALVLGLSVLTVFQTFPMNLATVWEVGPQYVWQAFALTFLVREDHLNWKGYEGKGGFIWFLMVFLMFYIEPFSTFFFMASYFIILITTLPEKFEVYRFFKLTLLAGGCAVLIMVIQVNWVRLNYPEVRFSASSLLFRTGFDGDDQYYSNQLDLLLTPYQPWAPRWKILLFFGTLATSAVIFLAQWKRKHLNHQTILLMGIASFFFTAFFFSQNGVIHPHNYEHILASPMILALFALLPAWLESFNRHSGVFVIFSGLTAFAFAGLQMLAYWLHAPPFVF